jgi:hypothetical protein
LAPANCEEEAGNGRRQPRAGTPKSASDTLAKEEKPWARHRFLPDTREIKRVFRGSDGVRLGDFNRDGLIDIVTPFEEGRRTAAFANPGPSKVTDPWPYVVVSKDTEMSEDAFFADIDGDGQLDIVICETSNYMVRVCFGPDPGKNPLVVANWTETEIPASKSEGKHKWLNGEATQIDGRNGIDIVVGSCNRPGSLGWLAAPADPRKNPRGWTYHEIDNTAYWVMSVIARDMDGDTDMDILISNRASKDKGVRWLENPTLNPKGVSVTDHWNRHIVGATGLEAKFIAVGDVSGDGMADIVVPTQPGRTREGKVPPQLLWYEAKDSKGDVWLEHEIEWPVNFAGSGKGAAVGDINLDGQNDIILSGEYSERGLIWLEYENKPTDKVWIRHEVAGPVGIKYDQVRLLDLDSDGDLDIATTVEKGPGLVWYENPTRSPKR